MFTGRRSPYKKTLVVTVDAPFTSRSLEIAALLTDRNGLIETFYVMEISPASPVDAGLEVETTCALGCLEGAGLAGKALKKEFLPAYVKTRQAGKAIIEHRMRKGFDLVIFDLQPGDRLRRSHRKLAESLQDKAGCDVLVVAGFREDTPC